MRQWLQDWLTNPALAELAARVADARRLVVRGQWGSSAHLVAGALHRLTGRPVLLVQAHLDDADEAVDDLALFDEMDAATFPALEVMPGESNVSLELMADRLDLLGRLHRGDQPGVIVAPVQGLMQSVPPLAQMNQMVRQIAVGDQIDLAELGGWLTEAGYHRAQVIEQPGDFAIRGGILDVFPPGGDQAVRIDLFGDQVDDLAEIDLDSMGSDRKLQRVRLIGTHTDAMDIGDQTAALWQLLDARTIVVMQEPLEIAEQARGYFERLTDPIGIISPPAVIQGLDTLSVIELNQFAGLRDRPDLELPVRRLANFAQGATDAIAELAEMASGEDGPAHRVIVLCQKDAERERLRELLAEHQPHAADRIALEVGYLHRGFVWGSDESEQTGSESTLRRSVAPSLRRLALIPHHELFHRYATRRRLRRVSGMRQARAETFFDLEEGNYVVHNDHGIAVFCGMRTMRKAGRAEEYLTLEFADRVLLHVPASEIEQVQKYIGGFAGRPPLSKLGGKRWKKQKAEVAEAVKNLAAELLRVQAARQSMPGIAFPDDSPWMHQFEEEFPYEETDDQLAAIAQAKRDMTSDRPMDRLLCGDVGFGKTEVAMRAAFKAVEAGRQVAVLCPTTVLCEQHERTFAQRMADYPVRVESISRFKTAGQASRIIEAAAEGRVDILIGTHRILSDDVRFRDLGLVVIDEEQRFGVEHKNKLMRFRLTVDVLTMSATPIPRTLHMAMLGLRDISSLSTPPADRRAIVTEVIPHDNQRIRDAILRELNRDGQCYFVHNRVHNIQSVAGDVRKLVPEAKVIVGHGQMKPRELEDVMLRFIRGQADVLVCTTIIESGIDIPTANTMFIADADHFGLAELHQLRGRVGRHKHRAYCYMLLPLTRTISEVASKRLRAIEQFSMLGAGFKIAMRDMEIRGVGNILGPEQSGHIATVGYQMYCQLLEEATHKLRNEPAPRPVDTHLELQIAGQLPKAYIPSDKHRMEIYRRIHRATALESIEQVERDLTEAYGEPPAPAATLFELAEIRVALQSLGVESLTRHDEDLVFSTRHVRRLQERLADAPGSVRLVDSPTADQPGTVYFRPPGNYLQTQATLLAVLRKLLVRPLRESVQKPRVVAAGG